MRPSNHVITLHIERDDALGSVLSECSDYGVNGMELVFSAVGDLSEGLHVRKSWTPTIFIEIVSVPEPEEKEKSPSTSHIQQSTSKSKKPGIRHPSLASVTHPWHVAPFQKRRVGCQEPSLGTNPIWRKTASFVCKLEQTPLRSALLPPCPRIWESAPTSDPHTFHHDPCAMVNSEHSKTCSPYPCSVRF